MGEFDHRVAEYRRQLIDFVRHRLSRSDRELGSDFVQDTLLEAQECAELLRALTPRQTLAWLVNVLKNKMANASRTRQRRDELAELSKTPGRASPRDRLIIHPLRPPWRNKKSGCGESKRCSRCSRAASDWPSFCGFTPVGRSTRLRGKPAAPERRFTSSSSGA